MGVHSLKIGVDIDNVLSNFNDGLFKAFQDHDQELRNTGIINKNADFITKGMFDWSQEEIDEFYSSNIENIIRELKPIEGAAEYLRKLRKDGHKIYIISGRDNGEYPHPYELTKDWLEKYHFEYDELILTNAYNSIEKANICKQKDIQIMIDDSRSVCKMVNESGVEALLMDTLYNKQTDHLHRVYHWNEIYHYISNYSNSIEC